MEVGQSLVLLLIEVVVEYVCAPVIVAITGINLR